MSDTAPPKLEVVPGGAQPGAPRDTAAPSAASQPASLRRTWPAWLLLVLLLASLIGLGLENRRAGALEAEVAGLAGEVSALELELVGARAALTAHRDHLDRVRDSLAELSALAAQDPTPQP